MKKKIFKYFACMITVAILATTLLLSWVNYEMFKGRVMSDLEAYGRVFAVVLSGSGGERDALESLTREKIRVTLVRADGEVDYDNFADPADDGKPMPTVRKSGRHLKPEREPISAIPAPLTRAHSIMRSNWKTATCCGWLRRLPTYGAFISAPCR